MPQEISEHTPRSSGVSVKLHEIFIPSKGRPDCPTSRVLQEAGVQHTIVVEPQDFPAYLQAGHSPSGVKTLKENNQGIAYVRNQIKEVATRDGLKWFWMLDDDITGFFLARDGKTIRSVPSVVLAQAQQVFARVGMVGQGALEYQQFSWSAKKDHAIGYCDVAVCINTERTRGISYRPEMALKEDRDFTLQVLASGMLAVRASKCSFHAPKNGSNKGGLYDVYAQQGRERAAVDRMVAAWPNVCVSQTKPDGRYDLKINWKAFRPPKA